MQRRNYIDNEQQNEENNDRSDDDIVIKKSKLQEVLSKLDHFLSIQKYFISALLLITLIFLSIIISAYFSTANALQNEKQQRIMERKHFRERIADSASWYYSKTKDNTKQYSRPSYETGIKLSSGSVVQKGGNIKRLNGTVRDIEWLKLNEKMQNISQVLYDPQQIEKKYQFFQQRLSYIAKLESQYPFMRETLYNMRLDISLAQQESKSDLKQYERLQKMYQLQDYDTELPLCIITPGHNNNVQFRIENNLNSIFIQNYTNYFLVLIDDASDDGSHQTYMKYMNFYNINPNRYAYVRNVQRLTALENIYRVTYDYCSNDSIIITVDGDDELIGKNTFKIFNAGYQKYQAGSLYSNFVYYKQDKYFKLGFTEQYTQFERANNLYRQTRKFSMLRSYRSDLFRKIIKKDLQYDNGTFFKSVYDMAIFYPIFQLSCSRVYKLEENYYLYNYDTGTNDILQRRTDMIQVVQIIQKARKYNCDPDFNRSISYEKKINYDYN